MEGVELFCQDAKIPQLRFPGFDEEWRRVKISDLLTFFTTNSLAWDQLDYQPQGVCNLHYGMIHRGLPGHLDLSNASLPRIKENFLPKTYTLCCEGDIVFADTSESRKDIGKALEIMHCNGEQIVCGLHTLHGREKQGECYRGFKAYAFSSPSFRRQLQRLAQGSKVYSIRLQSLANCMIGIPSRAEQKKITDMLSLIDRRMATQSKIIGIIESLIIIF